MLVNLIIYLSLIYSSPLYTSSQGMVRFESKATLEKIIGTSNELKGIINPLNNTFQFSVAMNSFHGFNSQLQKEHYQENYVESDKYPNAYFKGKIIEDIDYTSVGTYFVRAKGNFELHGFSFNKIMEAKVIVKDNNALEVQCDFSLNLREYSIKVPRLVHKKLAENLKINVTLTMNKQ